MRACLSALVCVVVLTSCSATRADEPYQTISLDAAERERCIAILREGFQADDFWPSMHAAEGLTVAGLGKEVREALTSRVPSEKDDQHRCGLARELVRAGDLSQVKVLAAVLASPDSYGHTHASESLFKVKQLGDKGLLKKALHAPNAPKLSLMAAAALSRFGDAEALPFIREQVGVADGETARTAAWILARVGDASDIPALRASRDRYDEPLTKAYFQHALAALGDAEGKAALVRNLGHEDPAVRVYAAEFAPDGRVVAARETLIARLDDEVPDIRIRAAHALLALSMPKK